jgi:V/A-type H+-transporting ATPase subunit E
MGYPELLRVLEGEAAREARDLRAAGAREAARIVEEAERAARAARDALLARERTEAEARRRSALEGVALQRERRLLFERRKLLDELRAEVLRRLPAAATPELDARLLAEVLPEASGGPIEIVVDPGREEAARAALAARPGAIVRAAAARRGGVEIVAGRRVLDNTLPSRLDRVWPVVEAELADLLLGDR